MIVLEMVDYLILDYVAEFPATVDEIARPNVGEIMNKPSHRLTECELTYHLHHLIVSGLLYAKLGKKRLIPSYQYIWEIVHSVPTIPNYKVFSADLPYSHQIQVGLTPKGGEIWELVFKPDWKTYCFPEITFGETEDDERKWVLEQLDKPLLQQHIKIRRKYLKIQNNEIKWEIVSSWQVTYWKSLPQAYRATFTVVKDYQDKMSVSDREFLNKLQWLRCEWKYPYDEILELIFPSFPSPESVGCLA